MFGIAYSLVLNFCCSRGFLSVRILPKIHMVCLLRFAEGRYDTSATIRKRKTVRGVWRTRVWHPPTIIARKLGRCRYSSTRSHHLECLFFPWNPSVARKQLMTRTASVHWVPQDSQTHCTSHRLVLHTSRSRVFGVVARYNSQTLPSAAQAVRQLKTMCAKHRILILWRAGII